MAVDGGRLASLRRLQEGFYLCAQRFDIRDFKLAYIDAGARSRCWREAADGSVFGDVINDDIIMRLKESHLAYSLSADARGSDVGDRAGSKFYPRVGRVHTMRQDRNPHGAHVRHFDILANQPLHYVKVVNHQIEHDIYIKRARGEFTDAVYLEIERSADVRAQGDERGVEAFEMPYLKQRAAFQRGSDYPVRFFESSRDWFFNEDVNASFEQRRGDGGVRFRRHGEAHGVNAAQQVLPVNGPICFPLDGDLTRGLFVGIADGDELRAPFCGECSVKPGMLAAQMTDPYDGCA
jgi:hypothetical protein